MLGCAHTDMNEFVQVHSCILLVWVYSSRSVHQWCSQGIFRKMQGSRQNCRGEAEAVEARNEVRPGLKQPAEGRGKADGDWGLKLQNTRKHLCMFTSSTQRHSILTPVKTSGAVLFCTVLYRSLRSHAGPADPSHDGRGKTEAET